MNCTSIDLKEYFFGETSAGERRLVEEHLHSCVACRDELERLRLTQASLLSVREEEVPRRIAFVSDKVFEPRWYQRLWGSAPRLGFASAALLALAIFAHAPFFRPAPQSPPVTTAADPAAMETRIRQEVASRIDAAVQQALRESETRQQRKTAELVRAAEQRLEMEHRAGLLAVQENFDVLRKRMNVLYTASADLGVRQ